MTDDLRKFGKTLIAFADTPSVDAFARQRVSEPLTLFDSKQIFDNAPLFWDDQEVSGSGTSSNWSKDTASTVLAVGNATAGKRVRQTFMRFNYQPGKSQLIFMTGTLGLEGGGAGVTRSAGLFDDENGIFFRDNKGTIEAVIRSSTSGSPSDDAIPQSQWNIDTLDGEGRSKIELNPLASQILVFDFEWLGVGRVRCGFVIGGKIIYVHEFNHSNIEAGVFMSTPNLPLRFEIENDGTGAASSLETICSTVVSEGGQNEIGALSYHSNGSTPIQANNVGTIYALIGMRLKSDHIGASVRIFHISVLSSTTDSFEWLLIFNPTVANSGSLVWTDKTNSSVQTTVGQGSNPSTTTITGGHVVAGGYVKSTTGSIEINVESAIRLGAKIDGTPDQLFLCVRPLGANADVSGSITYRELS